MTLFQKHVLYQICPGRSLLTPEGEQIQHHKSRTFSIIMSKKLHTSKYPQVKKKISIIFSAAISWLSTRAERKMGPEKL